MQTICVPCVPGFAERFRKVKKKSWEGIIPCKTKSKDTDSKVKNLAYISKVTHISFNVYAHNGALIRLSGRFLDYSKKNETRGTEQK